MIKKTFHEIMSHRARRIDFLDLQRDGIGLENTDPDGKQGIAGRVLKNHDGRIGQGVHHQTLYLELYLLHASSRIQ